MSNLVTLTIASETFLLLSFIIIFLSTRNTKKNVLLVILLIIGGAPLLYLAIDHVKSDYVDANIGLGLAFMYTWIYSVIAFVIAITLFVKKKRNNNIPKEQQSSHFVWFTVNKRKVARPYSKQPRIKNHSGKKGKGATAKNHHDLFRSLLQNFHTITLSHAK